MDAKAAPREGEHDQGERQDRRELLGEDVARHRDRRDHRGDPEDRGDVEDVRADDVADGDVRLVPERCDHGGREFGE